MKEIAKEKLMTTKEVAAQLGCSVDTITNACKRIFPAKMVKGKKTFFNESEITIMIDELKKNKSVLERTSEVTSEVIRNTTTSLTPAMKIKQAMLLMEEGYKEELARIEAENKLLEQKNQQLQIELDESKEWYSVKRMEKLNPDREFKWSLLKKEIHKTW